MQNKVELSERGPGQKMGCNKLLKNQQMGFMLSARDLEADLWAY